MTASSALRDTHSPGTQPAHTPDPPRTDAAPDFARWIGSEGWWRLAPDIRRRFSEHPGASTPIRYCGVMHRVDSSWIGWAGAQIGRLFGTPFAPFRGRDVPVTITLRHGDAGGTVWEREYHYRDRAPVQVRSVKRSEPDIGLLECVGFGIGMRLAVFEANRALHFLSLRYFCTIAGRRQWLPAALTPGTAHVVHTDLGDGRFHFSMSFHHRLLGTLFQQDGIFSRAGEGTVS